MVAMPVADDHVLDLGRVESEFFQTTGHFFFNRILEDRVDDDDPFRRGDGPGGPFGLADEVEVVEHLHRLGVPLPPMGRSRLLTTAGRLAALRSRRGLRRGSSTHGIEETGVILGGGAPWAG